MASSSTLRGKSQEFLRPKWIKVTGRFWIRGGIAIDVEAERSRTK